MARPSLGSNAACHIGLAWASMAQRLRPMHGPTLEAHAWPDAKAQPATSSVSTCSPPGNPSNIHWCDPKERKKSSIHYNMEQLMHRVEEWVHQQPIEQIYVAFAVLIFTISFFGLFRVLRRSKSNTILLAGLSGSGKTVLFYQLRDGSPHLGTVTSMEPNDGTFVLHSELEKKGKLKPVHLIDVPGHSRLRPKLDELLPHSAGVIFVMDSLDFLPNCRAAAEYLYDILTKAIIVKRRIPMLILCNKADKVTAHSKEFIRKQLEKEIDKLRASRSAISTADIANDFTLGIPGEAFAFSQCRNKVTVAESSGLTGEVSQAEQFIRELVKP